MTQLQKEINNEKALWALFFGIVLVAANLRAPISAVGPLLSSIQESLGLTKSVAGSMTTIPLVAFALLSPFAPRFARKFGTERTIFVAFIVLTIGIAVRIYPSIPSLFIGTAFVGAAIAICNVLLPAIIKQHFPLRLGLMTGIYGLVMNITAALSSGISEPLSLYFHWSGALAIWGILAVSALFIWSFQLKNNQPIKKGLDKTGSVSFRLRTSSLAWFVTAFMGVQSFLYYTVLTWLPQILETYGYSSIAAGWMLASMQGALFPMTFLIPILAGKMKDQRFLSVATGVCFLISSVGLLIGFWLPLWVLLMGVACGSAFGLAMMFFPLRTKEAHQAAKLSGMAQSLGYLLAASGPVLFGFIHELSGGWRTPMMLLVILSIVICFFGFKAGSGFVEGEK
ncbi:MFS transporter [Alkalihalobacillus alcalophilus]|uniref:CynX/NimT family MFS transporter n=1 Tax=Alkalihalobacillus alcalophilus TaxID=1445 RepID=UPI00027BBCF6|nr:MFS transporter [Alkalihalobacillus alcalophilus]MED1562468.1 MFS transporter [Alkalihalobacillus alcalophilus]